MAAILCTNVRRGKQIPCTVYHDKNLFKGSSIGQSPYQDAFCNSYFCYTYNIDTECIARWNVPKDLSQVHHFTFCTKCYQKPTSAENRKYLQ